jgi:hypothetical protein
MADGAIGLGNPNVGAPKPVAITFRYYRNPKEPSCEGPPGIAVQVKSDALYEGTLNSLKALYGTKTGRKVIDYLVGCDREIKIQASAFSNSCDVGPNGMTRVAQELSGGTVGEFVRKALQKAYENSSVIFTPKYRWFADKLNKSQVYSLGHPAASAPPPNIKVTEELVEQWMNGEVPVGEKATNCTKEHIINSIIVELDHWAESGGGSGAAICFYAGPELANALRPAGIGLAHELIHAYWAVLGRNPGYQENHFTTVLFEHKCVGLGHWDGSAETVCENQIRLEWPTAAVMVFEPNHYLNRGNTNTRRYYDKDAPAPK